MKNLVKWRLRSFCARDEYFNSSMSFAEQFWIESQVNQSLEISLIAREDTKESRMAIASSTDSQFYPSNFDVFPCDFILSQI